MTTCCHPRWDIPVVEKMPISKPPISCGVIWYPSCDGSIVSGNQWSKAYSWLTRLEIARNMPLPNVFNLRHFSENTMQRNDFLNSGTRGKFLFKTPPVTWINNNLLKLIEFYYKNWYFYFLSFREFPVPKIQSLLPEAFCIQHLARAQGNRDKFGVSLLIVLCPFYLVMSMGGRPFHSSSFNGYCRAAAIWWR